MEGKRKGKERKRLESVRCEWERYGGCNGEGKGKGVGKRERKKRGAIGKGRKRKVKKEEHSKWIGKV